MILKNQQEVIDFIGKETVLKFDYIADNIATFKTCIIRNDNIYEVALFFEEGMTFFNYDNFYNFMEQMQVFTVYEVCEVTNVRTKLYEQKYKGFQVGDEVQHIKFGSGTVTEVIGEENSNVLQINFENYGYKKILTNKSNVLKK